MHQIYYDTETTGSSTAFDSITEIYLSLNGKKNTKVSKVQISNKKCQKVIISLNSFNKLRVSISNIDNNKKLMAMKYTQILTKLANTYYS